MSLARLPTITHGAMVLPVVTLGRTDASAINDQGSLYLRVDANDGTIS
jgi:hypothetical protein